MPSQSRADCVSQLRRTAQGLSQRPFADAERLADGCHDLAAESVEVTRLVWQCAGRAGGPPDGVSPHRLPGSACAAQLEVVAADLEDAPDCADETADCCRNCRARLDALAASALAMRRDGA